MTEGLYECIVRIVMRCHTWINIKDVKHYRIFVLGDNGTIRYRLCRTIVLVCLHTRKKVRQGTVWTIPEFEIDNAVRKLKADEQFNERLKSNSLSMSDVQLIISQASYGLVNLDLEDW
jgi:hypothetical protein